MSENLAQRKIAVIHDWLPLIGGGERVLSQILGLYPDAHVYTLFDFLSDDERASLGIRGITVSGLNKLPGVRKYYRNLLPFCPMAIERFDLSAYDLVISSSHTVAKGVITGAHQVHVSYVHSPARYAWDFTHQYLREAGLVKGPKAMLARYLLHKFRIWDARTPNGVDHFIANSHYIRRRIWKVYRRDADVIHPPVEIDRFTRNDHKEDFYLTASRMVPYKRMDLVARAFADMPDKKLVIIGDGPEMEKISRIAEGKPNITLLGYQSGDVLIDHMRRAKAFVFAAEEDFGIIPVEAQACGTPVIAFGKGGALETVISYDADPKRATGVYFEQQDAQSIVQAVQQFERIAGNITPDACRKNAETFTPDSFRANLSRIVEQVFKGTANAEAERRVA